MRLVPRALLVVWVAALTACGAATDSKSTASGPMTSATLGATSTEMPATPPIGLPARWLSGFVADIIISRPDGSERWQVTDTPANEIDVDWGSGS